MATSCATTVLFINISALLLNLVQNKQVQAIRKKQEWFLGENTVAQGVPISYSHRQNDKALNFAENRQNMWPKTYREFKFYQPNGPRASAVQHRSYVRKKRKRSAQQVNNLHGQLVTTSDSTTEHNPRTKQEEKTKSPFLKNMSKLLTRTLQIHNVLAHLKQGNSSSSHINARADSSAATLPHKGLSAKRSTDRIRRISKVTTSSFPPNKTDASTHTTSKKTRKGNKTKPSPRGPEEVSQLPSPVVNDTFQVNGTEEITVYGVSQFLYPQYYSQWLKRQRAHDAAWALACMTFLMALLFGAVLYSRMWRKRHYPVELSMDYNAEPPPSARYSWKDLLNHIGTKRKYQPMLPVVREKRSRGRYYNDYRAKPLPDIEESAAESEDEAYQPLYP